MLIEGNIIRRKSMNYPVKVMNIYVKVNPSLIYVCDPVMGDTGPGLYVPK